MKRKNFLLIAVILSLFISCSVLLFGCFDKHVHSYFDSVIPPTCTSNGYTLHVCECGDSYTDNVTPMTEHTPIADDALPATCTQTGLSEGSHCGVCGETLVEQTVTSTVPHTPVTDVPAVEATCLSAGRTESAHCGVCGEVISHSTRTEIKEHSYENDICIWCGNFRPTEGLIYTLNSDGETYSLTGAENVSGVVHVAAVYNGKRVTSIGQQTFLNNVSITRITLPDGIEKICSFAFGGCTALGGIIIPDSVTAIDDYAFSYCTSLESIVIPENVVSIGKGILRGCSSFSSVTVAADNPVYHADGNCLIQTGARTLIAGCGASVIPADGSVTAIGESAFEVCTSLTSITIPQTVTTIGYLAFDSCGISSIEIPQSVTALGNSIFYRCASLTNVTLHEGLKSIGDRTFYACGSLESIDIPNSVETIGSEAFSNCKLSAVNMSENLKSIGDGAFAHCKFTTLTVPQTVTSIGEGAFSDCTLLESMTIPYVGGSIKDIAYSDTLFGYIFGAKSYAGGISTRQTYGMFSTTPLSRTYYIPESLKRVTVTGGKILYGAFENCVSLEDIILPQDVEAIGKYAFSGCTALKSLEIPNNVKTIDSAAFDGCRSLKSIVIPDGIEKIESGALKGAYIEEATLPASAISFISKTYLKKLYVTSGTSIGEKTFENSQALETVELADSISEIGAESFKGCLVLSSVKLPSSLTEIPMSAFENCRSLTDIDLSNITSIGLYAFRGCSMLDVDIPDGVIALGNNAFDDTAYISNPAHCKNGLVYAGKHVIKSDLEDGECVIADGTLSVSAFVFENSSITSVTIPASMRKIGQRAFQNCTDLLSVKYLSSADDWCKIVFEYDYSNPLTYAENFYVNGTLLTELALTDQVTSIGNYAFINRSFTEIVLPDSVQTVGRNAFEGCSLVARLVGNGLTSIGEYAFSGCTALDDITLGSTLNSIGLLAFQNCSALENIVIPNSVQEIGAGAFSGCGALKSMTLPFVGSRADATEASQATLFGYIFGNKSYDGSISITQYISSKVSYAFYIPEGLSTVTVTGGKVLYGAFYNCINLVTVSVTGTADYIGSNAFYHCYNLTSATVGANVTYIGVDAFYLCDRLANAYISVKDGWAYYEYVNSTTGKALSSTQLNPANAAVLLRTTYRNYIWKRN